VLGPVDRSIEITLASLQLIISHRVPICKALSEYERDAEMPKGKYTLIRTEGTSCVDGHEIPPLPMFSPKNISGGIRNWSSQTKFSGYAMPYRVDTSSARISLILSVSGAFLSSSVLFQTVVGIAYTWCNLPLLLLPVKTNLDDIL
jgi:hypothetical protein